MESKPYADQTVEERLKSLDRLQNVLVHPDWSELYLRLADHKAQAQQSMDDASNWDSFVAARAIKLYIQSELLNLREMVAHEKSELESQAAADEVLPPTDYELD